MALDLFADRFHRRVGAQEPVGQGLIFAQQSEEQVFGLYIRRAELAGLVPREKDNAPGFLRVAFKHILIPPQGSRAKARPSPNPRPNLIMLFLSLDLLSDICFPVTPVTTSTGYFPAIFLLTSAFSFLHLFSRYSLCWKRFRRHFFHSAPIQAQHSMAPSCKCQVMRC